MISYLAGALQMVNRHSLLHSGRLCKQSRAGEGERSQEKSGSSGSPSQSTTYRYQPRKGLCILPYQHDRSTGSFAVLGRLCPWAPTPGNRALESQRHRQRRPTPTVLYRYIIIETHSYHGALRHPRGPLNHIHSGDSQSRSQSKAPPGTHIPIDNPSWGHNDNKFRRTLPTNNITNTPPRGNSQKSHS